VTVRVCTKINKKIKNQKIKKIKNKKERKKIENKLDKHRCTW
jgi:hypothetical protein